MSHVGPEIERQYVLEFGIFEYELYNLELKIDKLKRKLQLIQIEINHGNSFDLDKIETISQGSSAEGIDNPTDLDLDSINKWLGSFKANGRSNRYSKILAACTHINSGFSSLVDKDDVAPAGDRTHFTGRVFMRIL